MSDFVRWLICTTCLLVRDVAVVLIAIQAARYLWWAG